MVGPYAIYFDAVNECCVVHAQGYWVCCLGTILDTVDGTMNLYAAASKMLAFLCEAQECQQCLPLWDYLDDLNGRHVVIWGHEEEFYLVNDATAMRSVWYSKRSQVAASHYGLLQRMMQEEHSPYWELFLRHRKLLAEKKMVQTWCMPGDLSPYNNIHLLLSNHCLQMDGMTTFRFWPRENLPAMDIETVADYMAGTLKKETTVLARHYDIFQSLTMGNDSRISLAAVKPVREQVTFFTYALMSADQSRASTDTADMSRNMQWAEGLCKRENLKWIPLDIARAPSDPQLFRIADENHYHKHLPGTVPLMREMVQKRDARHEHAIHLRSNLIELIRDSYYNLFKYEDNPDILAQALAKWSMWQPGVAGYDEVVAYYRQLIADRADSTIYDYDIGTIFYMEYRMSQWQGAVAVETDPAFDTFMLFNHRNMLRAGMSIPKLYKDNSVLTTALISRMYPEVLHESLPNIRMANWENVDHPIVKAPGLVRFDQDLHGRRQYELHSGNLSNPDRRPRIMAEPRLEGIRFGFAGNQLAVDDYVEIQFHHRTEAGKPQYYEFDLFTLYTPYSKEQQSRYQIWVNDRCIYSCGMNSFTSKTNQVVFTFDAQETRDDVVKIRILVKDDTNTRLINGALDVRTVILRQQYTAPYGKEMLLSTEQLLQGKFPNR